MKLLLVLLVAVVYVSQGEAKSVSTNQKVTKEGCEYGHDKNWDPETDTCDLGLLIKDFHPRCDRLKKGHVKMSIGQSNYIKCGDKWRRFTCFQCGGDYTGWMGDAYESEFNYEAN